MPEPAPPYDGYDIPERFRDMAYAELPPAIKHKLEKQAPVEAAPPDPGVG